MAHLPPAVSYPVDTATLWVRGAVGGLFGAWALAQGLWAWHWRAAGAWPGAWWWSGFCALCLVAWTLWHLRFLPVGTLSWDPADDLAPSGWRWTSAAYRRGVPLARVECVLDGQSVQLLKATTSAGLVLWLWPSRRSDARHWTAFRQALLHGHRVY